MRKFLSLLLALLLFLPLVPTAEVHAASSMRGELFRLINQERTEAGLSSLNANSYLNACSVVRTKELFQSPSHTRPDGRDWRTVLEDKNLPVDVAYSGEIWCGGYSTAASALEAFMNSPAHREILMDKNFNFMGVGYGVQNGADYWVVNFTRSSELQPENDCFDTGDTPAPNPPSGNGNSGTCGDGVTWSLDNGKLTISGNGPMNDYYNVESIPWYGMRESIKSIKVEAAVTHIGAYAFTNCLWTQHVQLEMDCLTSIGPNAFMSCGASSGCFFGIGANYRMTEIGAWAFYGCNTNTEIDLPSKLVTVKENAFYQCKYLPSIYFPATVKEIEYNAFAGCASLRSIIFMGVPETISYGAFEGAPADATVEFHGTRAQWDAMSAGKDMTTEELLFGKGNTAHNIKFLAPAEEPVTLTLAGNTGSDGAVQVDADNTGLYANLSAPTGAKLTNVSLRIYSQSGASVGTVSDDRTGTVSQNPARLGFTLWKTPSGDKITYSNFSLTLGETYQYELAATVNGQVYTTSRGRFRLPAPEVKTYTVTFFNPINGTSSTKTVTNGQPYGALPTPASVSGYTFEGWYADTNFTQRVTKDSIVSLTKNQTLYARMIREEDKTVSLTLTDKTGLSGVQTVSPYNGKFEATLSAPSGCKIAQHTFNIFTTGGSSLGSQSVSCSETTNGTNYSIYRTLSVTGSTVPDGATLTWFNFKLTTGSTYLYDFSVVVDGKTYTTQRARFRISANSGSSTGFTDVKPGAYYADAVKWAVEKGITAGKGSNTFKPDDKCTRGEIVTFLWRSAGSPEPRTAVNPFKDVKEKDYYYKAVLWAVENDITAGKGAGTFKPGDKCTRAEAMTFMWRAAGEPAPNGSSSFKDVVSGSFYEKAVGWAVEKGITAGKGTGTFKPNDKCSRAEIVSFLYRGRDL